MSRVEIEGAGVKVPAKIRQCSVIWMTFNSLCDYVFIHFRRRRMRHFFNLFVPSPEVRVLDIGGTPQTWTCESQGHAPFSVTMINIRCDKEFESGRFHFMLGDATQLPFGDNAFDIVFSNRSAARRVG